MKIVLRCCVAVMLLAGLVYLGDYLSVAIPLPKTREVFGSIVTHPYYAISLKYKKIEYDFDVPPVTVVCVHSWFPHFGDRPCWYVARNLHPEIDE